MKKPQGLLIAASTIAAISIAVAGSLSAQDAPVMEMTTDIPDGITTPDTIETQLGDLTFFDGVPDAETAQKVYDLYDFSQAYQAYISGIKIASLDAMLRGIEALAPANTHVAQFADLMDSKALFLTPNTTSVYQTASLRMTDEPWVIETPPNVLGFVNNAWFKYVLDFGNLGPDEGQGGKFLILPPGYEGDAATEGYTAVVQTTTYAHWVLWRGFTDENGSPDAAVEQTRQLFRMYPLSRADSPPEMTFVNVSGQEFNTIHLMDERMFEEINAVIQAEPLDGESPELLGYLDAIGIVKGQTFAPDARMQSILKRAAAAGAVTVKTLISQPRDDLAYWYPGESFWQNAFPAANIPSPLMAPCSMIFAPLSTFMPQGSRRPWPSDRWARDRNMPLPTVMPTAMHWMGPRPMF